MSAPTPAPGDDSPCEGYYPDPSIPGYVRYWNGAAWVPGTSRPAPKDGEHLSPPPGSRPMQPAPAPAPAVEETGPHFFDEEPIEEPTPGRSLPGQAQPGQAVSGQAQPGGDAGSASAWGADRSQQSGFGTDQDRRVSWGSPQADPRVASGGGTADEGTMMFRPAVPARPAIEDEARSAERGGRGLAPGSGREGAAGANTVPPQSSAPHATPQPSAPTPQPSAPAQQASRPAAGGAPTATPATPAAVGGQSSWAQQVHQLAGSGAAGSGPAGEQPVTPWRPPADDPFAAMVRQQTSARPAPVGKRLAARLLDTVVLGAVTALAAVPLGTQAVDHVNAKIDAAKQSGETVTVWLLDGTTSVSLGIVLGVLLLAGVVLEVLPTAKWGRTLGKRVLGLEVRDIEAHDAPAFGAALRRWLVYVVPGLLVVGVVGVLWGLFDRPWRQCWHDKAARTFVAG